MPIYEYKCMDCGKNFEILVFGKNDEKIICPGCKKSNLKKLFSTFASIVGKDQSLPSCATGECQTGMCQSKHCPGLQ